MRTTATSFLLVVAMSCTACTDDPASTDSQSDHGLAPLFTADPGNAVPGRYIVALREGTNARGLARASQVTPHFVYEHIFDGFAATLNPGQLEALRRNPAVRYIEEDKIYTASDTVTAQVNPVWNLDRIDQRYVANDGKYQYVDSGGGVDMYIIDSGTTFWFSEYGSRAWGGVDLVDGGSPDDCDGHGTWVAGIAGSRTYGVAKGARMWAVRVLDCYGRGWESVILSGMEWVKNHHTGPVAAVANMSLGGPASNLIDEGVAALFADGVFVVAAAGNEGQDACTKSPARAAYAVAASEPVTSYVGQPFSSDAPAIEPTWSTNWGTCVDIFAPGVNITSWSHTSSTTTVTAGGTSGAAPHVAGTAALVISRSPSTVTMSTLHQYFASEATSGNMVQVTNGSPNRYLYSRATGGLRSMVYKRGIGWEQLVAERDVSGMPNLGWIVLEAVRIYPWHELPTGASVQYRAHVQNVGWMSWVTNGATAGTVGQNQQLEAVQVVLVNAPGWDVCYQAHVKTIGWQPEVCNGTTAGTTGQNLAIDALRFRVVP